MFLSFNDALCEALVESKFQDGISEGDFRFRDSFRKQADEIYTKAPPRKREAAFFALYRRYFSELDCTERVKGILEEFSANEGFPAECIFARTFRKEEEGAQLSEDGMRLGVQIRTETLCDPVQCAYLLRHELTHILDILDPAFGYDTTRPLSEVSPSEESLFRDRYRTLWDLSIDGRLARKELLPQGLKDQRAGEFSSLFPNLGAEAAEQAVAALWNDRRPSSDELREMVTGAASLCAVLNIATEISDEGESRPVFGPGSLCPLCQFPTHEWAETADELTQAVKEEYPAWEPYQGICSQCANRYLFTAAFSTNSPSPTNQIIDRTSNSFSGSSKEDI